MASTGETGWTTADYQALCAAIASGHKQVQYSDKMVTYHSVRDMLHVKQEMEAELDIAPLQTKSNYGRHVGDFHSGR